MKCDICDNGHTYEKTDIIEVKYRGKKTHLKSYYMHCDSCGSDYATPEQASRNAERTKKFRSVVDTMK